MGRGSQYPVREAGYRFGDWVVIKGDLIQTSPKRKREFHYLCYCVTCKEEKWVYRQNLEKGKTKGCVPCANARNREEQNGVYVRFKIYSRDLIDRLANRYYAILSRCRGVGSAAHRYEGRGIVCKFENVYDFVEYCLTLDNYDKAEYQIDREDNDGNYEKGNLRFVTAKTNGRNKEKLQYIEYDGKRMCAVEFWEQYCPKYRECSTVNRKIREGTSLEQILAEQSQCRGPNLRPYGSGSKEQVYDNF